MILTANSNGEDDAPSRRLERRARLREFNKCHNPSGPGGGQFCSAPDAGSGGGPRLQSHWIPAAIRRQMGTAGFLTPEGRIPKAVPLDQPFAVPYPPQRDLHTRMLAVGDSAEAQFAFLQQHAPHVVAAARQMIQQADRASPEWEAALTQLSETLGFARHNDPNDEAALRDEHSYVFKGLVKSVARAAVKSAKYNGDVAKIRDLQRATIGLQDLRALAPTLQRISEVAEIVHIDDRINHPTEGGYRDVQVIVRLRDSGLLAEFLILSKPMLQAKKAGHLPYEEERSLPKGHPRKAELNDFMTRLYSGAWARTVGAAAAAVALALLPTMAGRG